MSEEKEKSDGGFLSDFSDSYHGGIKYFYDIEQGSNEWFDVRLGIVTASNINTLLTPTGKPAKNEKVENYAYEIVAQRETWRVESTYQSFDMERGHLQEDIARNIYSENYNEVNQCGFVLNTKHGLKIGCSPDGLVGCDGGIEIKSRLSKFQIKTVVEGEVDQQYTNQIQACLLVTERKWWDFVQYSNGMPMYVKRVLPDLEIQESILESVKSFEDMCCDISEKYNKNVKSLIKTDYVDFMMDDEIMPSERN